VPPSPCGHGFTEVIDALVASRRDA
jgi:hypothetical protein